MDELLLQWVTEKEKNGIKQHSGEWHAARVNTISGSILAIVQGVNKYQSIGTMIAKKIGIETELQNIKMFAGTLFEPVIKVYVEMDKGCQILGEDLYVRPSDDISYSPDGLAVLDGRITLFEFKCPYNRIPTKKIPDYYMPQILMGMEVMDISQCGMFVEAIFRRCSWDDMDETPMYTNTIDRKQLNLKPIAMGFIGFYSTGEPPLRLQACLDTCGEFGNLSNGYMTNDLGAIPEEYYEILLGEFNKGNLIPWYSDISLSYVQSDILRQQSKYEQFCRNGGYTNVGIVPWKLFKIMYHGVEKVPNYLAPWMEKIREVLHIIRQCNDPANAHRKMEIYQEYVDRNTPRFSDDC